MKKFLCEMLKADPVGLGILFVLLVVFVVGVLK